MWGRALRARHHHAGGFLGAAVPLRGRFGGCVRGRLGDHRHRGAGALAGAGVGAEAAGVRGFGVCDLRRVLLPRAAGGGGGRRQHGGGGGAVPGQPGERGGAGAQARQPAGGEDPAAAAVRPPQGAGGVERRGGGDHGGDGADQRERGAAARHGDRGGAAPGDRRGVRGDRPQPDDGGVPGPGGTGWRGLHFNRTRNHPHVRVRGVRGRGCAGQSVAAGGDGGRNGLHGGAGSRKVVG